MPITMLLQPSSAAVAAITPWVARRVPTGYASVLASSSRPNLLQNGFKQPSATWVIAASTALGTTVFGTVASALSRRAAAGRRGATRATKSDDRITRVATTTIRSVVTRRVAGAAAETGSSAIGPQVVFVIGGPGSGKGTQCERIAKELGYVHLSAGELLRAERKVEGSPFGAVIEEAIRDGGTVPSEVIAGLLEQAMRKAGWSDANFVVDGYPRSAEQLRGWETTLSTRVQLLCCLSLEVGLKEMKKRLLKRAEVSGRLDDNDETIEKRFITFGEETGPLLDYFGSKGLLQKVDGERDADAVWSDVRALLETVQMPNDTA
mmetsp:Transcript_134665/g.340366  ORF Transcript_134665/g.340366 Transcript_134665/m.340366 type:complete len:321 (-) Transcript_134665:35-997(-)